MNVASTARPNGIVDIRPVSVIRVLVIDDSPGDTEIVREELGSEFEIQSATSVGRALSALSETTPDVVLLDLFLPDSSKLDGLATVLTTHPDVPVIVLTGLSGDGLGAEAISMGAQDYLAKASLDAHSFRRTVRYAVERHRHRVELQKAHRLLKKEVDEKLRAEAQFGVAFQSAPIGMAIVDSTGLFVRVNPSLGEILSTKVVDLENTKIGELLSSEASDAVNEIARSVRGHETEVVCTEQKLRSRNGAEVWCRITFALMDAADIEDPRFICQVEDISERRRIEHELVQQSLHDSLTGLPNRSLMNDRLDQAIAKLERNKSLLAVMFLDLDRFKFVNDTFGHDAGDSLIVEVARRLRSTMRPSDTVARLGGDEFVVVAEALTSRSEALHLAERVSKAISAPLDLRGERLTPSASVGVAIGTSSTTSASDLLREADIAMYHAKDRGKARVELFDDELRLRTSGRANVETELRRAIAERRVIAFYQPIVDLRSGEVCGAEALARVVATDGKIIPPSEFISIAEETGLIVPLGATVLDLAVQFAITARELDHKKFEININLSIRQAEKDEFADRIVDSIERSGLRAANVTIELTESILLEAGATTLVQLQKLKAAGIGLAMDDFGTGYSSLTYLRQFPVDTLKIDRSFVSGMIEDEHDFMIVKAIVGLGQSLGLRVVAEGVESIAQLEALTALGCHEAQGYLFGKPMPAEMFLQGMREHPKQPTVFKPC